MICSLVLEVTVTFVSWLAVKFEAVKQHPPNSLNSKYCFYLSHMSIMSTCEEIHFSQMGPVCSVHLFIVRSLYMTCNAACVLLK